MYTIVLMITCCFFGLDKPLNESTKQLEKDIYDQTTKQKPDKMPLTCLMTRGIAFTQWRQGKLVSWSVAQKRPSYLQRRQQEPGRSGLLPALSPSNILISSYVNGCCPISVAFTTHVGLLDWAQFTPNPAL